MTEPAETTGTIRKAMQNDLDGMTNGQMSFWEHLDALRAALLKSLAVSLVCGIVAFLFKDELFTIVLAPKDAAFVTYDILSGVSNMLGNGDISAFSVQLINTGLAEQFVIHVKTAMCAGVLCASPYVLYQLFRFVSPALYANERKYAVVTVSSGYAMFMVGVMTGYFLIFPLTFRFLGTYQVSGEVTNMITLQSYMSTLVMMCLSLGIVFEMPILSWLFAKMGFLSPAFMRRYRRHAIVVILVIGAAITPTSDVFTLTLVSLPMYILYEVSIYVAGVGTTT